MAKVGDIVRFLSSTGGGRIVRIDGQIAHVEEEDGFETPVLLKELVVVTPAGESAAGRDASAALPRRLNAERPNVSRNSWQRRCRKSRRLRKSRRRRPERR